jgi:hypothetical protein
MSSNNSKLLEFFAHIPKLEIDGSNWVIFKDRFLFAAAAGSLKGHIDGSGKPPVNPLPTPRVPLTEDQKVEMSEYSASLTKWEMEENIMKQALASVIPDSLFIEVRRRCRCGMRSGIKERRSLEWLPLTCVDNYSQKSVQNKEMFERTLSNYK